MDPYWCDAYEATTFVGLAVNEPSIFDFSTSAGSGPFDEAGLDVLLVDCEDHYLAKVISDKGKTFLETAGFRDITDPDMAGRLIQEMAAEAEKTITASDSFIQADKIKAKSVMDIYDAPFWDDLAFSCINCGTCTYVCPTCWCFDIQDETSGTTVTRMRNWDTCMSPLFTLHSSGHNPRGDKTQRVRQRFMHKLKYFQDKYGQGIMCVGCGRCVEKCPANIDIREVAGLMDAQTEVGKMNNPYLPYPVRIEDIEIATEDKSLKTFKFVFMDKADEEAFAYKAGQFAELSIPGVGEIPIGIASSPVEKGFVKFTVFKTGVVTGHIHQMKPGDIMGIRGPLGNGFPWDELTGKNIVIIGGGFAFTTLRSSIVTMLDPANRDKFGSIDVVYGARSPGMLLYRKELFEWEKRDDINMNITVDGTNDPDWQYNVGFVPAVVEEKVPKADPDTAAIVCGPPIMIKFTQPALKSLGYEDSQIIMSLENRMKCGIGMCGRCNIGKELVCKDGPVFTLEALNLTPGEF